MPKSRVVSSRGVLGHMDHGTGFGARVLRGEAGDAVDPFLSLDHFRMSQPTFPPHPHAGFSAVTVMLEDSAGAFVNRDSLGDHSRIGPGDLHWTQAGRGMMHDEVPERDGVESHGLQVFVNLSAADELAEPRAFHAGAGELPVVEPVDGARVRVLAGEAFGARSPLTELLTKVTMLDVTVQPGSELFVPVPEDHNAWLLVLAGRAAIDGGADAVPDEAVGFARGGAGDGLSLRPAGDEPLHVFVGGGRPIGEPKFFGGPFAMSTRERLVDANRRFQAGAMGDLRR